MKLNDIRDNDGARKSRIRIGRGIGSGKGKTGGRGQKGQKSRSGVAIKGFEGGQMPLHMRLPKRGFNNPFGKDYAEVNIGMVQKFIDAKKLDAKKDIDHAALKAAGLARGGKDGVHPTRARGQVPSACDRLGPRGRGRADEAMGLTRRRDREVPISRRALALILDFSSKETSLMSNAVFSSTVDAASASAGVAAAAAGAACPTPPIICGIIIPPPPPDSSASLRPSLR